MSGVLVLRKGSTTVSVDADRGATITDFSVEPWGALLAQRTSELPLRASASTSYGDEQLDWLSDYDAGWHVLFPNAGDACVVDGIPLPFHGEANRAQWVVHEVTESTAALSTVCRLPLRLRRDIAVTPGRVLVRETATNLSSRDQQVLWGQHPVFPAPPGTRIDLPGGRVQADAGYSPASADVTPGATGSWPLAGGVDLSVVPPGACERYAGVSELAAPWAAVRDPARGVGVTIGFDPGVFGHLWIWLEAEGTDFPWLGNVRYLGVEPHSSWPGSGLAAAIDEGRATTIPAGESVQTWVALSAFAADERPVTDVDAAGTPTFG